MRFADPRRVVPRLAVVALLFAAVSGAAFAQDEAAERLRIHGSNLMGDRLMPALVQRWLEDIGYADIRRTRVSRDRVELRAVRDDEPLVVEIDKRGTASGFRALVDGEADIAMTVRRPTAAEREDAWQLGDLASPDQEWVLGLDGLVVLVAADNPVEAISPAQLRAVLSGEVRDWRELGGRPGPIRLHAPARGHGLRELADTLVMGGTPMAGDARVHGTTRALLGALRADPAGLGLASLRAPRAGLRALAIVSGGRAIAPDPLSVASEDYPLQRRVTLHTGQMVTALGRSFALYALSPAGQAVVERSPFVSLAVRPMAPTRLGPGREEYLRLAASARRLPMTVRFGSGIDFLDSRSRQDLDRLVRFLRRPENAQRRVLLLGFANPEPRAPYAALSLSQERVDFLASELLAQGMKVVSVRGFGGDRPLAEPGAPAARYRNTRVEVWLR